jgi:hypothetical protein
LVDLRVNPEQRTRQSAEHRSVIARHRQFDTNAIWVYHWSVPGYACNMQYAEWDWPPPRHRRYYRKPIDVFQPSGWNSPITKKVVRIYWHVTITIIKMLFAIPLSIIAIGAFWLLWTIITL